jgi:RNA polymerase sigma-70 factor, ECF subfamily
MTISSPKNVTQMLAALKSGDREALDQLIPVVYDELRRMAARHLRRERAGHTLQTTALIHETYLKLVDQRVAEWQGRAHFFGVASQLMRRILVDHARAHDAEKRGGGGERVPLEDVVLLYEDRGVNLAALDEALTKLEAFDPRQAKIVEMRYFGGLTIEETAEALGVSPATVKNDWGIAKAWLLREISRG